MQVLLSLSDNPEVRLLQTEHEAEKNSTGKRASELQEMVKTAELRGPHEQGMLDAALDGSIHTARNLGQIAAYFFQTGAASEAADFYMQAKSIFDAVLGASHPRTQQWQQDLFFLINAPAIQKITAAAAAEETEDAEQTAHEWWMQNLPMDIAIQSSSVEEGDESESWWMQNLYDMKTRDKNDTPDDEVSYMQAIFATPRGDGSIFTPRGTLNAALRAGMPMMPIEQKQVRGSTLPPPRAPPSSCLPHPSLSSRFLPLLAGRRVHCGLGAECVRGGQQHVAGQLERGDRPEDGRGERVADDGFRHAAWDTSPTADALAEAERDPTRLKVCEAER